MRFSTPPLLLFVILFFLVFTTLKADKKGYLDTRGARSIYFLLTVLISWGTVSAVRALTGVYLTIFFLSLLLGPFQLFQSEPSADLLLHFPMILAPSLIVPNPYLAVRTLLESLLYVRYNLL